MRISDWSSDVCSSDLRRGRLTQYVPLHARAWHAGVSSFEGRERCNDFSIGIELEGCDDRPFTQKQYRRLITVTHLSLQALPRLVPARITSHRERKRTSMNFSQQRVPSMTSSVCSKKK